MDNKKICVLGLTHLGSVIMSCLSENFEIFAYDFNNEILKEFKNNNAVISEPGVKDLIKQNKNQINYCDERTNYANVDIFWLAVDMPLDSDGTSNMVLFDEIIKKIINIIPNNKTLIISSQVMLGTSRKILNQFQKQGKMIKIAYSPENLRLGNAVSLFKNPDRIIIGCEEEDINLFKNFFCKLSDKLIFMSLEEAELTKHSINAFLALSITYINEISLLCEEYGLNINNISKGLKSENRIGNRLPLNAGLPFAGGTLQRDLNYLSMLSNSDYYEGILNLNKKHKKWIFEKINFIFKNCNISNVLIVGCSYKEQTNVKEFSLIDEICQCLFSKKVKISVFDKKFKENPIQYFDINFINDYEIIEKKYDFYFLLNKDENIIDMILNSKNKCYVLDPNHMIDRSLAGPNLNIFSVGRSYES